MDRNRLDPTFPDEKKLLTKCLARDKKAWDTFVERYNHLISHAIVQTLNKYSSAPRDQEIPDLFNTVFVLIMEDDYKKLRQFQWRCKLSSWLYIIAVRATIDFLRKQSDDLSLNGTTAEEISIRDGIRNGNPLPDDIIELNEKKEIIEQTKKMLTSNERFFAELYYICELSPTEIARIMNTTENNVYQLNSRVREKMKKIAEKLL
jgi:RNA polymerase sigma-70 factor (ECF subfamily)